MFRIKAFAATAGMFAVSLSQALSAATILETASFGGNTYHLVADDSGSRISWADSETYAESLGGHLVTVDNAQENQFILEAFGPTALAHKPSAGGLVSLLLGLNDSEFEGTFQWADHTPVQYTNFISGEPAGNSPDEDFVGMVVQTGFGVAGQWHDIISDFRFNDVTFGVVEVAAVPLPLPAPLLATAIGGLVLFRRRNK